MADPVKLCTLEEVRNAAARGDVAMIIDNDSVYAYDTETGLHELFEDHPANVLEQALNLLGIPWERP